MRSDVALENTWDVHTIFESDAKWEQVFEVLKTEIPRLQKQEGVLLEQSGNLVDALRTRDELFQKLSQLYVYASLQQDTDTTNTLYQGMSTRAVGLYSQAAANFAYFNTEIMAADENIVRAFFKEEPLLTVYQHEMDELLKARAHILSDKEEVMLARSSEIFMQASKTFSVLNNADLTFPEIMDEKGEQIQVSHGLYGKLLESPVRKVRKDAFKAVYGTYKGLIHTFGTTLSGSIKKDNFTAEMRGYASARAKAMFANNIPESVYDALVEAINDRLPLLHRYIALRKKTLKLAEIRMYDLYVPIVEKVEMAFTFEEAQQIILEGLGVLGEDYQNILKEAFAKRWIDHVENQGKRSGAYSSGTYGTNPFILMNWQDTLDNVYTLAHELGHSVHSYYTRANQPFVYGDYSIFLAEVASTTNENLLTDYLLKKFQDKAIRAYVINHYLDGVKGTIFRQTQFAEFEQQMHEADQSGKALTSDFLSTAYLELNKKYYGNDMVYDEEIAFEWARIPHFYSNFYVYQYATGFSAAAALSAKILREGEQAIQAYTGFLKAGSSEYPIDVLKKAGVDMTNNRATIDALAIFEQRLVELEALLDVV